jgi:hypothetical protein
MYPQNQKVQQKISRRKVKVQRLIKEQEARLAAIDPSTFPSHKDYLQSMSMVRKKLNHLEKELIELEAGKLPGGWE